jgi:hypothetical protein
VLLELTALLSALQSEAARRRSNCSNTPNRPREAPADLLRLRLYRAESAAPCREQADAARRLLRAGAGRRCIQRPAFPRRRRLAAASDMGELKAAKVAVSR